MDDDCDLTEGSEVGPSGTRKGTHNHNSPVSLSFLISASPLHSAIWPRRASQINQHETNTNATQAGR